jgi:hypothetical protein
VLTASGTASGTCVDQAGNSTTKEYTVKIDKLKPIITGHRNPAPNSYGWNNEDVTVSFTCADQGDSGVDINTLAGATVSTEGADQQVTNTGECKDAAGNKADDVTVTGINIDKTNPVADVAPDRSADSNTWYNHTVMFSTANSTDGLSGILSCTAVGNYSGPDTSSASVSTTCTDKAGNSDDAAFAFKYDATLPDVSVTGVSNGATYTLGAVPAAGCSTTDATSGVAVNAALSVTGPNLPVGSITAKCSGGKDNAGNVRPDVSVTYTVLYSTAACLGSPGHSILQPINVDGSSVNKQGSTVPAKFRVCDANGNSIGTPGVVTSFRLVQIINGVIVDAVNEPVDSTTPDAAFRWSATDQQWIYNISTKLNPFQKNKTYVFEITLNDNSTIQFRFGLK